MYFIKHFKHCRNTFQFVFVRNMSKFYVRSVDNEDSVQITFDYSHNDGVSRTYNASRPKTEEVVSSFTRIAQNINKHVFRKKKKKQNDSGTDENGIVLTVFGQDGVTKLADTLNVNDALSQGITVKIHETIYTVDVNPPTCLNIIIPQVSMVGFPLYPKVESEFSCLKDSLFLWEKIKYEVVNETAPQNKQKPELLKIIETKEIGTEFSYMPSNEDIGYRLKVTCIPKMGQREGRPMSVESKLEVTAGPGLCPFETRHLYCQKETQKGEIRVLSYNILTDLYADQDYSRDVLYSYCPPYALKIDYRKPLLIKELKGYKADIMCLQEVDHKVFNSDLYTALEVMGFQGVFKEKAGEVREGSAIFFKARKFRLIEEYYEEMKNLLETSAMCQDIVKKVYAQPALKEVLETRTTILHVVALEPVDEPGTVLLVANTHLYFHPDAGHIRMIQVLISMRFIESLMKQYRKQRPALIFCGDFNSTPARAIYEYVTSKAVKEDNIDWKDGGEDQFVPGMNFAHNLNLQSGCGKVPYTNYTAGFNGHLDYIYYDTDSFIVSQVIPPPDHRDVEFHTALPSIVFPSDHIAQICDLQWKSSAAKL